MKLNIEIVFDALSRKIPAQLRGVREKSLHLGRPEYYLGAERVFHAGRFYVLRSEQLPQRPVIEKGAAILCIGKSMYLPYYLEHCGVIQITGKTELPLVFNLLTEIYNRYDAWSEELQNILNASGQIREMVLCSQKIFDNPILVLDANFHFLVHSDYDGIGMAEWEKRLLRHPSEGDLPLPLLNAFLEHGELSTEETEAMLINILDSSTLCVNLFQDKVYSGCLIVDYRRRAHLPSDDMLAVYLARMIELALQKYTSTEAGGRSSLRAILQGLVNGLDSMEQKWMLVGRQSGTEYICTKTQFSRRLAQLPVGYMCSVVEKAFPNSAAFEQEGAIVCFIETGALAETGKSCFQVFQEYAAHVFASLNFDIGISDPFQDIFSAQLYYLQACSALENGRIFAPGQHVYLFQDYALTELIVNALGRFPIEMYYSDGFRSLIEHDASSSVSYIETLRTYLDKNMSVTKTTASLYINRSTLLERIARIKRELGVDLQDAGERLRLQILLKALQIQETMHGRPT